MKSSKSLYTKKEKSILLTVIVGSMFVTGLSAMAAAYFIKSTLKKNDFAPVTPEIKIQENNDPKDETINKELNFEISQNGNYTISEGKKVEIYNEEIKDDEYIRVKFVPCWISESDEFICANLQGISDFYGQSLNDQKNKLIVYNSFGEEIITYILNGNWQSNWIYNETDSCFYHKGVLKTGDSSVLLENVEISPDVAELAEGYKLKIDILADAVQQYGNVSDNRNNENWKISYE